MPSDRLVWFCTFASNPWIWADCSTIACSMAAPFVLDRCFHFEDLCLARYGAWQSCSPMSNASCVLGCVWRASLKSSFGTEKSLCSRSSLANSAWAFSARTWTCWIAPGALVLSGCASTDASTDCCPQSRKSNCRALVCASSIVSSLSCRFRKYSWRRCYRMTPLDSICSMVVSSELILKPLSSSFFTELSNPRPSFPTSGLRRGLRCSASVVSAGLCASAGPCIL